MCFIVTAGMLACKEKNGLVRPLPVTPFAATFLTGGREAAVPVSWYQLELKLISESNGFTPPVAARAIACTGMVLHEAVVWGMKDVPNPGSQLNGLLNLPKPDGRKKYNWAIAANSAMADIIKRLLPNASEEHLSMITQLEIDNLDALCDSYEEDVEVVLRSVNFGRQIAGTIHQWSVTVGGKGA